MKSKTAIFFICVFLCEYGVNAFSLPGPKVYVVTPSARTLKRDDRKPTPFYYHNWMRRMDTGTDTTTTTTTTDAPVSKAKTPDLIFAEFESGSKQKSIRKLLEKERIQPTKTTMSPIYVPDEDGNKVTRVVNYGLPVKTNNHDESSTDVNYSLMSHEDIYNLPTPVYVTAQSTTLPQTTTKITTPTPFPINIQNIWDVIDSQKSDQYSNDWEEISLGAKNQEHAKTANNDYNPESDEKNKRPNNDENSHKQQYDDGDVTIDDNFALPGFATNPGNGAENESRAIRTEQNIKFPYINLKPFQVKSSRNPALNNVSNGKKSNLYTNLDNFYDLKNPVRGEAQDVVPLSPPIDRYNPAQPYLPHQKYGSNLSKQSSPVSVPSKATANLVPPPPLPPQLSSNDFPAPASYESFPPYAPSSPNAPNFGPAPVPASPSSSISITPSQTVDITSDFDTSGSSPSDDGPAMDIGYRYKPPSNMDDSINSAPMMTNGYHYKPPSAPTPQFYPTPEPSKPFQGYSYNKPSLNADTSMTVGDKPFQGYHYSKPVYKPSVDSTLSGYGSPPTDGHDDIPPEIFEHDDSSSYSHDSDDDMGGDDMNGHDMGMKPPPLITDVKPGDYVPPPDDHGFPSDFPTDFKFPPDFDDHHHQHYHDHDEHYYIVEHPTTTTETPRVNRFSYYYLGKKLYYLPLYFSVYFIIYVGALIIKAVLRHKIVYPNSWRPNSTTATFFSKRSVDEYLSRENLHELTKKVTHAIAIAAEKYMNGKKKLS